MVWVIYTAGRGGIGGAAARGRLPVFSPKPNQSTGYYGSDELVRTRNTPSATNTVVETRGHTSRGGK